MQTPPRCAPRPPISEFLEAIVDFVKQQSPVDHFIDILAAVRYHCA